MRVGAIVITAFAASVFTASALSHPSRPERSVYSLRVVTAGSVKRVSVLFRDTPRGEYPQWSVLDLSPNRRQALMIRSEGSFPTTHALYVADIRGHPIRRMMETPSFTPRAGWSPDGARFYYTTLTDEPCNQFTFSSAAPDGGHVRRLGSGSLFAWGPGHRSFAIEEGCGDELSHSLIFTNRAGQTFEIARGWAAGIAVSPRGGRIAYETYERSVPTLHIAFADGRGRIASIGRASSAKWSADGSRIAFVRPVGQMTWNGSIAVADANGRRVRVVARGSGPGDSLTSPGWSPDGRRIAFLHENSALETVRPNGRGRRLILEQRTIESFWWSPDGRRIFYSGYR